MVHRFFEKTYEESKKDLNEQIRMNLFFIKSLPQVSGKAVEEIGRETEEGVVPEFIPIEKIKKHKKKFKE
jgi:hypothetical protein